MPLRPLIFVSFFLATTASADPWTFTDVTLQAGVSYQHGYVATEIGATAQVAGGVAAGDYDDDGWVDLYVVSGDAEPSRLFRNRGDGTFEDVAGPAGVALTDFRGSGPTFADYDGDGRLDLLVPGIGTTWNPAALSPLKLFRNRGDGTFEDATASAGIVVDRDTISAAFGDYDRDGDLDLFLTHWGERWPPGSSQNLWRNEGNGTFADVSDAAGITAAYAEPETGEIDDLGFTPNFADIDGDGWPDLLVAGDFGNSKVLRNDRDGTFTEITTAVISDENGMGGAVADYDRDGDLDWFVSSILDPNGVPEANWGVSGNRLYRNMGNGVFEDATDAAGVRHGLWGWGSTFADLDNDGHVDLFHVNGWAEPSALEFHADPARCFVANGDGTFTERALELGVADPGQGRGVVAFDYDRDGDLDLFIANNQQPPRLYRNDGGNAGNYLTVALQGGAPNAEGIGARVEITVAATTRIFEVRAGSNYVSQDPAEAHFGLGPFTVVDQVRVLWPTGAITTQTAVAANQRVAIAEPTACGNGVVDSGGGLAEQCDEAAANGTAGSCCNANCTFRFAAATCRTAIDLCDHAETCTGSQGTCPADAFQPQGTVCRPAAGGCDVAEACTGSAAACPTDLKSTAECRAAAGVCDVAESCDGASDDCPADRFAPATTECRAAAGACDLAEACTGAAPDCPVDAKSTAVCRSAAGPCDVAEACDGTSAICPADAVQPTTVTCRAPAGPCDAAESCDGVGVACAADALLPGGTLCRAGPDACNLAGFCTGSDSSCPGDGLAPAGASCEADGNPCTVDACDGGGACQHSAGNAGVECRAAAGDCDLAETCTGTSIVCPLDARRPAGAECTDDGNACTVDRCDGDGPECTHPPGNAGAECRPAAGTCDVAEHCDGTEAACPADAMQPSTLVCRPAAGVCDTAELCDGTTDDCPANAFAASTVVCRGAAGACDLAERCTGADAVCPDDALLPDGTPCDGLLCTLDACAGGVCVSTPEPGCFDDFQCYRAATTRRTPRFQPVRGLALADAFEQGVFDATRPRQLCSPAGTSGDPIEDSATYLSSYELRAHFGAPRHVPQTGLEVMNRLGTLHIDTREADLLLVPSRQSSVIRPPPPDASTHDVDRYKCYPVRMASGAPPFPRDLTLTIDDELTGPAKTYRVRAPQRLCAPVGISGEAVKQPDRHLMCYAVTPAPGERWQARRTGLLTNDEIGPLTLDTRRGEEVCLQSTVASNATRQSAARQWNEELLAAIRIDLPRPPVHARNLFLVSVAMWDAWAAYDSVADAYLRRESPASDDPEGDRAVSIGFAAYRTISHLYALSVNAPATQARLDARMSSLSLDMTFTSTLGDSPAAVGNRIAAAVIAHGQNDGSNEAMNYADPSYTPVNAPLIVKLPGAPMNDPNRWQPLALDFQVSQNGIPIADKVQKFVGSQWDGVAPFALTRSDPSEIYIDPGPPPQLGAAGDAEYKAGNVELILFSSQLDPADPTMLDISPASWGNHPLGTNDGQGYAVNPVTGGPYAPQLVKRADFFRVLAEFWADGPDSETPPGHWNSIANELSDHPAIVKRIGGTGPVVDDLEWDVKTYLAVNGAVHDAAVAAWGIKRRYDSVRPISQIRTMADRGQSSDPSGPSYDPSGLPLVSGLIEVITAESSAPGERHEALAGFVGEIAVYAWPGEPEDPATQVSGARWTRARTWIPYQRKTFVTPPFAAYVSGHSTYSRAAAEVLTRLTGSPYFPGGLGEFVARANEFLTFEEGPTNDVRLQWATFYDAADQAGISRLYGGIHPRADDLNGRMVGSQVGVGAWELASRYFQGTAVP